MYLIIFSSKKNLSMEGKFECEKLVSLFYVFLSTYLYVNVIFVLNDTEPMVTLSLSWILNPLLLLSHALLLPSPLEMELSSSTDIYLQRCSMTKTACTRYLLSSELTTTMARYTKNFRITSCFSISCFYHC